MNKQETAEAIKVMQAWIDGADIEALSNEDEGEWVHIKSFGPSWGWSKQKYRIKPSPREFWITVEPPGETLVAWSQEPLNINGQIIKVREVLE